MKSEAIHPQTWDYLLVTASNSRQAESYERQLSLRRELGLISGVRNTLVFPDPGGRRVGSGGSTLHCLITVLNRELRLRREKDEPETAWIDILRDLRILIVHAGGDSKRLPPYGPCGKIFVPVPGETDRALGLTLLDRQLPHYMALPPAKESGQTVITTGDVLLSFDPSSISFEKTGITGVGCYVDPELARNHGVFSPDAQGRVRRFFQKPSPEEQISSGAVNRHGHSILDIGIMNIDESAAASLLELCDIRPSPGGDLIWTGEIARGIEAYGLDFFLEICCALGAEASLENYREILKRRGSRWPESLQEILFSRLSKIPFHVELLHRCGFLHFGTLRQLIQSGRDLMSMDIGISHGDSPLEINTVISERGRISGAGSWVEGCRIDAGLTLKGKNVLVGLDVNKDLTFPEGLCLDVMQGKNRSGRDVWFVRPYGVSDLFNSTADGNGTFCNIPVMEWISRMESFPEKIWDSKKSPQMSLWEGRFFPAVEDPLDFYSWMWMYRPENASSGERKAWEQADRYSLLDIAELADQDAFHIRRHENRAEFIRKNLRWIFRPDSDFSARELAFILETAGDSGPADTCASILKEAFSLFGQDPPQPVIERFELSRIFHTLGSALGLLNESADLKPKDFMEGLATSLSSIEKDWLKTFDIDLKRPSGIQELILSLKEAGFINMGRIIVWGRKENRSYPVNALRSDEIVWGRAPARLDLAGGWSDTPPYSLENGGEVLNAAVDLNSQPPIHTYARVISTPEIRISSIDHGSRLTIHSLDDLLDYKEPTCKFGLAKAALALSGFSPHAASWPEGIHSLEAMLELFGGGIEITTLAAIPSGSGLGTSSIMGAVLISVLGRIAGRIISSRELFNMVLQLEQELTTGGGWQDQIGGVVDGVKHIRTEPALIPDPRIHYVPADILDPRRNGGTTLLFYTGLRRLAKNILGEVVGRYLDRDRNAMDTLRRIHHFPRKMVEAMSARDMKGFGRLIGAAWTLKKDIDPESTTEDIENIIRRVERHIYGATLLGAGGGGFLLLISRNEKDASSIRKILSENPPNERARFFDFSVSTEGLRLTVC